MDGTMMMTPCPRHRRRCSSSFMYQSPAMVGCCWLLLLVSLTLDSSWAAAFMTSRHYHSSRQAVTSARTWLAYQASNSNHQQYKSAAAGNLDEQEKKQQTTAFPESSFAVEGEAMTTNKKKPHKQPAAPRAFKHLFRHYDDISFDSWLRCSDPESFLLSVGFSTPELEMLLAFDSSNNNRRWSLSSLDVHDQLAPKIRFLVETLGGGSGTLKWKEEPPPATMNKQQDDEECVVSDESHHHHHTMRLHETTKQLLLKNLETTMTFFSPALSLDRKVAPYHAYLVSCGRHQESLPHSHDLLKHAKLWNRFLLACAASRNGEEFVQLCRDWDESNVFPAQHHSVEGLQEFLATMAPGLIPASKHSSASVSLLVSHGANAFESDAQGVSPLHWAAGNGNLEGVQALVEHMVEERYGSSEHVVELLEDLRDYRKGATPFHWACASIRSNHYVDDSTTASSTGGAGTFDVCRYFLQVAGDDEKRAQLANMVDGNGATPLMWAAWASPTLAICDLLLLHGADIFYQSNGQTALQWAAAAGHLEICQYLLQAAATKACADERQHDHANDDDAKARIIQRVMQFLEARDSTDKTALEYARINGHAPVVEWMQQQQKSSSTSFLVKETSKGWFVPSFSSTQQDPQNGGSSNTQSAQPGGGLLP